MGDPLFSDAKLTALPTRAEALTYSMTQAAELPAAVRRIKDTAFPIVMGVGWEFLCAYVGWYLGRERSRLVRARQQRRVGDP